MDTQNQPGTCPKCGDSYVLRRSSNGRYQATHRGASGGDFYPSADEAIAAMVRPYTGHRPGACPQAWQYDPAQDGEPDWATPD